MGRIYAWMKFAGAGVAGFAMTLPIVGTTSCGNTACIVVSQLDVQQSGGACPDAGKALNRFSGGGCGGLVTSVDGAGQLDGQLCCYPVTQNNNNDNFDCLGGFGGFGVGGFSGEGGSGFGGEGGGITVGCAAAGDPCDDSTPELTCCTNSGSCDFTTNSCP